MAQYAGEKSFGFIATIWLDRKAAIPVRIGFYPRKVIQTTFSRSTTEKKSGHACCPVSLSAQVSRREDL